MTERGHWEVPAAKTRQGNLWFKEGLHPKNQGRWFIFALFPAAGRRRAQKFVNLFFGAGGGGCVAGFPAVDGLPINTEEQRGARFPDRADSGRFGVFLSGAGGPWRKMRVYLYTEKTAT